MDLGAAAEGIALVSLAGKSLASLAVAILCAGLAALGWFSRKKWYLLACLVFLLADLIYLACLISSIGIGQLPMFAPTLGTILAVGITAIVGLGRCRPTIQFRLWTLLMAVLVLSLPLSWFAWKMEKARRQREAVEAIEGLGGDVFYDWGSEAVETGIFAFPPKRSWGRALLGNDYFDEVEVVFLNGTSVADAELAPLASEPHLTHLFLQGTDITDVELKHVEGLTKLISLDLGNVQVTNAGLEQINGLTNLKHLDLGRTHVTDYGFRHLERLNKLEYLDLMHTQVTAEAVMKFQASQPDCTIVWCKQAPTPQALQPFDAPQPSSR